MTKVHFRDRAKGEKEKLNGFPSNLDRSGRRQARAMTNITNKSASLACFADAGYMINNQAEDLPYYHNPKCQKKIIEIERLQHSQNLRKKSAGKSTSSLKKKLNQIGKIKKKIKIWLCSSSTVCYQMCRAQSLTVTE